MTVAYWIVASLLALFYLYAGGLKVLRSPDQLRPMMGWIDTVPLRLVRAIGVLEVLGALGLILPPRCRSAAAGSAPAPRAPPAPRWFARASAAQCRSSPSSAAADRGTAAP